MATAIYIINIDGPFGYHEFELEVEADRAKHVPGSPEAEDVVYSEALESITLEWDFDRWED